MTTDKVFKGFFYEGEELVKEKEVGGLQVFIKEGNDLCIITDKDLNILIKIGADCNQNFGYLFIED